VLLPKSSEMQQGGRGTQEQLDYATAASVRPGQEEAQQAQTNYFQQQNRLASAAAAEREEADRQAQLRRQAGIWDTGSTGIYGEPAPRRNSGPINMGGERIGRPIGGG